MKRLFAALAAVALGAGISGPGAAAETIDPEKLTGKFFFVGYWQGPKEDDIADLLKSIHYKREIYVALANGKQRRHLVKDYESIYNLHWSHNKNKLSFRLISGEHPDGMLEFDLSRWDGGEVSPGQAKLSLPEDFPTPYYVPEYRVLPTGKTEIIPGEKRYRTRVTFSPDGSQVAGVSKEHICITAANGALPAQCVAGQKACEGHSPVWSPDGKQIVFVGPTADDGIACNLKELFIFDTESMNVRQLTDIPGEQYTSQEDYGTIIKEGVKVAYMHKTSMPAWSPDGQWIAFFCLRGIAKIRSDGSGFQVIAPNAAYPTWSPDGTTIAYAAARGDTRENFRYGIFVSRADGSGETWITRNLEMVRGNAQFIYEDLNWAK